MLFEHLDQVLDGAEDRSAEHVADGFLVVEEADHLEAELAMVEDLLRHLAAEAAGADDQDPRQVVAAAAQRAHGLADREPSGGDEQIAEEREGGEESAAVGEVEAGIERLGRTVERRQAGDQNGGEGGGEQDRERLFDAAATSARLVQPAEVEDHRPGEGEERQQPQVVVEVRSGLLADQRQQEVGLEAQPPRREERGDDGDDVTGQTRGGVRAAALVDQAPTLNLREWSAKPTASARGTCPWRTARPGCTGSRY